MCLLKQGRTVSMCRSDCHVICSKEEAICEPMLEIRANLENTEVRIQSIGHPQRAGYPCSPTVHYAWIREADVSVKGQNSPGEMDCWLRNSFAVSVTPCCHREVALATSGDFCLYFNQAALLLFQPVLSLPSTLLLSCCHVSTNRRNPNTHS